MVSSFRSCFLLTAAFVLPSLLPHGGASSQLTADTGGPAWRHPAAAEDNRVGIVVDQQGTALVRPVARERWSPLRQRALLMPGDWVRTSVRGANAVEARLASGGTLILGPGSLVELQTGQAIRLYRGEVSVEAAKDKPIVVTGPGGFRHEVAATLLARAGDRKTARLATAPRWLEGYRNSTTDEWVGSLLAKVDGREVPLSVGYHKVDAVIRDQIAQTTVEQSFVNSTKHRLEGVFYFPLPADASISGFGMWIGGELVEADLVEKQRARQIYEDILRRKKDPGLLEWSGGNLFKARVFPIEAHSEKRIRIRYTQVLPREGSTVRYRYALRSELLRKRPLRSLAIKVTVASAVKIESVVSTSHEARIRRTDEAAVLEYDAQEVTPERDFEALVTLAENPSLTVVPHLRGEDGYFMMLLAPPDAAATGWQRELTPEGAPVDLMLIADTSASMDQAARDAQADFVQGLLGMLGKKDRFRLATADVEVQNFTAEPSEVSEASIAGAMSFLAARDSLGWTDLDRVLAAVDREAGPGTLVIYLGDGAGTTGDADPVALAKRVRAAGARCDGVVHAVSLSSSYEQPVLEALAGIGGGSVRRADGEPLVAAYQILAEAAQPSVKDVRVTFEGVQTARVYPGRLPNLPVGHQQVILGRFLPTGKDQVGRATVTGTLAGKPVRYTAPIQIRAAEAGNSFIPRLWARRHLDALLSQGQTEDVQEDIVGFSREFGIMTPYTSFLVLENEADRKRYGVERLVGMRDGEAFFAEGRDAATTEILRQQMRQARTYRLELRMRMLEEIAGLGRSLHGWTVAVVDSLREGLKAGGRGGAGITGGSRTWGMDLHEGVVGSARRALKSSVPDASAGMPAPSSEMPELENAENTLARSKWDQGLIPAEKSIDGIQLDQDFRFRSTPGAIDKYSRLQRDDRGYFGSSAGRHGGWHPPAPTYDFARFGFPHVVPPPKSLEAARRAKWSKEVLDIVAALDRRPAMRSSRVGFVLRCETQSLNEVQGGMTSWNETAGYYVRGSWLQRHTGRRSQPATEWVREGMRGRVHESLALGRQRPAVALDGRFQFPLYDDSTRDLALEYARYSAELVPLEGNRVRLVLTAPQPRRDRVEWEIETLRDVVLRIQRFRDGELSSSTVFSDFVQLDGQHFAQLGEQKNERGQTVWRRRLTVSTDTIAAVAQKIAAARARLAGAVIVAAEDPKLSDAKQAIQDGRASFAERLRIVTHYAATQRWDEAWNAWSEARKVLGREPSVVARAVPAMRLWLLSVSRRGEEFRGELAEWNAVLAKVAAAEEVDFLTDHQLGLASGVLSNQERLDLLGALESIATKVAPVATTTRDTADAEARDRVVRDRRAGLLASLGRTDASFLLREETARRYPRDFAAVDAFVAALGRAHDRVRQGVVLAAKLKLEDTWRREEIRKFYAAWLDSRFYLRDLPGMERISAAWIEAQPEDGDAYHRNLACQMFRDGGTAVDTWVAAVLATDPKDEVAAAKLHGAVLQALSKGWHMGTNSVAKRWHKPLADLVRRCVRAGGHRSLELANTIFNHSPFRRTDAFRALRKEFVVDLLGGDGIAKMDLDRLAIYMRWVEWGRNQIAEADWVAARAQLRTRFDAAIDADNQQVIGGYVLRLVDAWRETDLALAFLRHWMDRAIDRPETVARTLFNRLLAGKWTPEKENEIFALVPKLQPEVATAEQREQIQSGAIRAMADKLVARRTAAALGDVAALEKLPRAERRERETQAEKASRKALAERFAGAAAAAADSSQRWYSIERLGLALETGSDRAAAVASASKLLDAVPGVGVDGEPVLHRILRERCALAMAYAATRRGAARAIGDAALARYQQELKTHPDSLDWRYQIFRLTVALDRTDVLETLLRSWIVPEKADTTWRQALGYLLAERGDVAAAVEVLEGVRRADGLDPADYAALANWHLVLRDDKRRERALHLQLETSTESQLATMLQRTRSRATQRGGGVPGALSSLDFLVMQELMRKAPRPQNHVWQILTIYRATKDFRVLACLPYGVLGHTRGNIYTYLKRVAKVLAQVHEEATCDSLTAAIQGLVPQAEREVDRRGLQLVTAQVERRAAEVLNAPGDHVETAVAAMQKSFTGEWERGERQLMSGYLASLGKIDRAPLAAEQLRQLAALFSAADLATGARLAVGRDYAGILWGYNQRDKAVDVLNLALREYRSVFRGVLPSGANQAVAILASYYRQRRHFAMGETYLREELARQVTRSQKTWYTSQLFDLYVDCVAHHGQVSLGSGETLYLAIRSALRKRMWEGATDEIEAGFRSYLSLHQTAAKAGIRRAGPDLIEFCKASLPELAPRFVLDQGDRIQAIANSVGTISGSEEALEVVVAALEREPKWLRRVNREYWRNLGWAAARHRAKARDRGLDRRLLPFVLAELRTDLRRRSWRNNGIWFRGNRYFWSSAAGDFAKVAEAIAAAEGETVATSVFAAKYLWNGLAQHSEAIDVLAKLNTRDVLHESGRWQLVRWLEERRRYDDAVPLLKVLVAERPDQLQYHTTLVRVLHASGDTAGSLALLRETAARWQEKKWWHESSMASLGHAAFETQAWAEAAEWYQAAVRANERSSSRRWNWRNQRSSYYGFLAQAEVKLGHTLAAVDAASAAVVTWGNDQRNRRKAIQALHRVLASVTDLDGYVEEWDRKVAESGMDAPLIRKQLGLVYLEKGLDAKAIAQLRIARELQPADDEIHKKLVAAYDRVGDKAGAVEALRTSIVMSPRNLDLYGLLARRMVDLGRPAEVERAYTSLVEIQPNEAESHRRLAKVRENQKRYGDAVVQWRQVVRVRRLEPGSWLGLAKSQILAGQFDAAAESIRHVLGSEWEARFKDAKRDARILQQLLESKRG